MEEMMILECDKFYFALVFFFVPSPSQRPFCPMGCHEHQHFEWIQIEANALRNIAALFHDIVV